MPNIAYILANTNLPNSSTFKLDAQILLAHVLQQPRSFLYAYPDYKLTNYEQHNWNNLITRRQQGEPIAYILGFKDFYNLRLMVNKHTLIARPETEILVSQTLKLLSKNTKPHILELGTGSGAIALALASAKSNWQILATDINEQTLQVAKLNAQNLKLNVQFQLSNWFDDIALQQFDLIVSNPPYISDHDPHLNCGDLRFEPKLALIAGKEGLDCITHIISCAAQYLIKNGYLLLEHGCNQGQQVRQIMQKNKFHHIFTIKDLANLERVTVGQKL